MDVRGGAAAAAVTLPRVNPGAVACRQVSAGGGCLRWLSRHRWPRSRPIAVALGPHRSGHGLVISMAVAGAWPVLAAVALWPLQRSQGRPVPRYQRCFAAALAVSGAGQIIHAALILGAEPGRGPPFPTAGDLVSLLTAPFAVAGLVSLARCPPRTDRHRAVSRPDPARRPAAGPVAGPRRLAARVRGRPHVRPRRDRVRDRGARRRPRRRLHGRAPRGPPAGAAAAGRGLRRDGRRGRLRPRPRCIPLAPGRRVVTGGGGPALRGVAVDRRGPARLPALRFPPRRRPARRSGRPADHGDRHGLRSRARRGGRHGPGAPGDRRGTAVGGARPRRRRLGPGAAHHRSADVAGAQAPRRGDPRPPDRARQSA